MYYQLMISLSNVRDSILCERQILNQNVQTSIFLIQKLSDPPTERQKNKNSDDNNDTYNSNSNNND